MGYLLAFARRLNTISKKNQLAFDQMNIQKQQENLSNRMTNLENFAKSLPENLQNLPFLQMRKQMLLEMSNNLDTRLAQIQTELSAANQSNVNDEAFGQMIASSAPKYGGY